VGVLRQISDYVDSLVHPSARADAMVMARHRAFIAPRLLGSLVALVAFPAYLAARGTPTTLEILVFGWLIMPILIAYYLSWTGRYERAHVLSAVALTGLVTAVAIKSGGVNSFAAIWLVIVPLEAALSASRRVVAAASALAIGAAGLLLLCGSANLLPAPEQSLGALAALGIISASVYSTGLALGATSLARTSFWLLYSEENRYRLLARNMSDVISRHADNGVVLFMSPAAGSLFGASLNELLGHGVFDRVHIADRPIYLHALSNAAATGQANSVEFRVRRDSNDPAVPIEFIWIEMRCRPLDQTTAAPSSGKREVVSVMRDVTARKLQQRELEEARTEAERANSAKGNFIATMSHELRTPLNAVIGFSDMLKNEREMALAFEQRHEYARLINESGQHLLSVVNDILAMSKLETGEFEIRPEQFALGAVIGSSCDLLALKVKDAAITLAITIDPSLPAINADKRALKQIVINLVSNAVKFSNHGGHVAVSARRDSSHVVIAVEDDGIGVREADLPRLGNPFFQSGNSYDRRHDGTGLGLSIVKALVGLHGGEIAIASRLGKGTRVTVRLPLDCEAARVTRRVLPMVKSSATVSPLSATGVAHDTTPIPVKKSA
jgi:cell cycle sensor histidine kinase DivJ